MGSTHENNTIDSNTFTHFESNVSSCFTDDYGMICNLSAPPCNGPEKLDKAICEAMKKEFRDQGDGAWRTGIALLCAALSKNQELMAKYLHSLSHSWTGALTDIRDHWRSSSTFNQFDTLFQIGEDLSKTQVIMTYQSDWITFVPQLNTQNQIIQNWDKKKQGTLSNTEGIWPPLPTAFQEKIDTACNLNGKTYITSGNQYVSFEIGSQELEGPYPLTQHFQNLPTKGKSPKIDFSTHFDTLAVVAGKVVITQGKYFIRYTNQNVDTLEGGIQPITQLWKNPKLKTDWFDEGLDVMSVVTGHLYITQGSKYIRYDNAEGTELGNFPIRHPGYNQPYSDDQVVTQLAGMYFTYLHGNPQNQAEALALLKKFYELIIKNGFFTGQVGNRQSFTMLSPDTAAIFIKVLHLVGLEHEYSQLMKYVKEQFIVEDIKNLLFLPGIANKLSNLLYLWRYRSIVKFSKEKLTESNLDKMVFEVMELFGRSNVRVSKLNICLFVLRKLLKACQEKIPQPIGYAAFLYFCKLIIVCDMSHRGTLSGETTSLKKLTKKLYKLNCWRNMALFNCIAQENIEEEVKPWLKKPNLFWLPCKSWNFGDPCWTKVDYAWQRTPSGQEVNTHKYFVRLDYMTLYLMYELCIEQGINFHS